MTIPDLKTYRLAVASSDGISINEHFGHAKRFLIYEVNSSQCRFKEERSNDHYCLGNDANQCAWPAILVNLKDCLAVFIARIGDGPKDKLAQIDVVAVNQYAYQAVQDSLINYVQNLHPTNTNQLMESKVLKWLKENPLQPIEIDCSTAVMLKILDGKCKMSSREKKVMRFIYKQIEQLPGQLLDYEIRDLIANTNKHTDESMRNHIYAKRVLAETVISRPIMKAFKAKLRQADLFNKNLFQ